MNGYFCCECEWSGDDPGGRENLFCPVCWGPALSVEAVEERAAIMQYSDSQAELSQDRAEFLAVASSLRLTLGKHQPIGKPTVHTALRHWRAAA